MSYSTSQTATKVTVSGTTTSVTLFAAGSPHARTVYNDSTGVCYLTYGSVSASTAYTTQIASGTRFDFPQPVYGGAVSAVWATAGTAYTTWW